MANDEEYRCYINSGGDKLNMIIEGRQLGLVYDINCEMATSALKDVDINIGLNAITGIVGPSGSGKSSLLYLLSGLKIPTFGTVYYNDIDISSYTPTEKANIRKSCFGFIFQRHFLIEYLSVLDNVLAAINSDVEKDRKKCMELLEALKISHLSEKKPFQLSCGQRQKTAVARALINNPKIIFADEPTASLDHSSAREVMDVLEGYLETASIVVVTHDRTILKNTSHIIELWDGHLLSF
jgi:putative ABC transport system ATP-binding protein